MPFNETLRAFGKRLSLTIGAIDDLAGDVFGRVPRPALGDVEENHPEGVIVLAGEEVPDDGGPIGLSEVGLKVCPAMPAEVLDYDVDVGVVRCSTCTICPARGWNG